MITHLGRLPVKELFRYSIIVNMMLVTTYTASVLVQCAVSMYFKLVFYDFIQVNLLVRRVQ